MICMVLDSSRASGLSGSVFDHPLQVTFTSSSPFEWPHVVLLFSGLNAFGNDMAVGYGATHVPPLTRKHAIEIPVCAPNATSFRRN
jgi:hypothetical protein